MRSPFFLALFSLLAACAAVNPFRLEDQVALFHDDLRWGRMPAAEQSVAASARALFARHHARWGREVQIVDLEVESSRIAGTTGTVRARFVWTRPDEAEVRETVVETRWRAGMNGSWSMDDEQIVGGDPALFASVRAR